MSNDLDLVNDSSGGTKNALLRAGLHLMADRGYHRTKVSDVVRHSGVTQGSFYWYFNSKLDMAIEVICEGRKKLLSVIERGYREESASLESMLRNSEELACDLIRFADTNREFMIILLARGHGADPKVDDAITETRQAFFDALSRNVKRARELGMLPQTKDTELKAVFLHRLMEGAIEWRLFGHGFDLHYDDATSVEDFAHSLVRFEFYGLLDGGTPPFSAAPDATAGRSGI